MSRTLLVFGTKNFKITIPDDAKITFGPWSPPNAKSGMYTSDRSTTGTLRIYLKTKDNIIGCFADVRGFRDLSMDFAEEVAKEEGAVIWKSDKDGYQREEKVKRETDWVVTEALPALESPKKKGKKVKEEDLF